MVKDYIRKSRRGLARNALILGILIQAAGTIGLAKKIHDDYDFKFVPLNKVVEQAGDKLRDTWPYIVLMLGGCALGCFGLNKKYDTKARHFIYTGDGHFYEVL